VIIKHFDFQKKLDSETNFFLFYGENFGLIEETIENNIKKKFSNNTYTYDETDILLDKEKLLEKIFTKSLFDDNKFIIINNVSDKILVIIEEIYQKILDIKIILTAKKLEKKSKLRNFFEKKKDLIIIPFYEDSFQSLFKLVQEFFYLNKIKFSSQIINLLVEKSNGNRKNLKNELEKIYNFSNKKKSISFKEINKLINLDENYDLSEIINCSLAKNKKKTLSLLNESIISSDENILILRTFLYKLKRLKKLKKILEIERNIDAALVAYKPQIFWKEKDIVKQQLKCWSLNQIVFLIKDTINFEILIKKNVQISNQLIYDFIINKLNHVNNEV
jgi:DNA polymerase-3 subunit delta